MSVQFPDRYSLSQQVFEASVQFYVIFVQVTEELVGAKNLSNTDQLENRQAHLTHQLHSADTHYYFYHILNKNSQILNSFILKITSPQISDIIMELDCFKCYHPLCYCGCLCVLTIFPSYIHFLTRLLLRDICRTGCRESGYRTSNVAAAILWLLSVARLQLLLEELDRVNKSNLNVFYFSAFSFYS